MEKRESRWILKQRKGNEEKIGLQPKNEILYGILLAQLAKELSHHNLYLIRKMA